MEEKKLSKQSFVYLCKALQETFILEKALVKASQKFAFGVAKGALDFFLEPKGWLGWRSYFVSRPKAKPQNLFEAEPKPICVPPLQKVFKTTLPCEGTDEVQEIFCLEQLDL